MEFFATSSTLLTTTELQHYIRIENLPDWCASIHKVLSHSGDRGTISCAWGEFAIHQEALRDGVRFTLPGSPHALQWTITVDTGNKTLPVRIHCTLNRPEIDTDFAGVLEKFVQDWKQGLDSGLERIKASLASKPKTTCAPWYG